MLTTHQVEEFNDQSFLVVPGVLEDEDFASFRRKIERAVDFHARQLHEARKISSTYQDSPLDERLLQICLEEKGDERISWLWNRQLFGPEIYELLTKPAILDIVESLIGPEITVNGDYWLRFKPPNESSEFPWHQDSIYYNGSRPPEGSEHVPTEQTTILSLWIPMVDVDETNGCIEIAAGSHKHGLRKYETNDWNRKIPVEEVSELGEVQYVPMKAGDVLVFHNLTFHRSGPNRGNAIRWSIDLRYSATGSPLNGLFYSWPGFVARSAKVPENVEPFEVWEDRRAVVEERRASSS